MRNAKLKDFTSKVDSILWKEWNPIGIDVPQDEYSTYALVIAGKVWRGEGKEAILEYLYRAENEKMGLPCTEKQAEAKNAPIVDKIVHLVQEYKV